MQTAGYNGASTVVMTENCNVVSSPGRKYEWYLLLPPESKSLLLGNRRQEIAMV